MLSLVLLLPLLAITLASTTDTETRSTNPSPMLMNVKLKSIYAKKCLSATNAPENRLEMVDCSDASEWQLDRLIASDGGPLRTTFAPIKLAGNQSLALDAMIPYNKPGQEIPNNAKDYRFTQDINQEVKLVTFDQEVRTQLWAMYYQPWNLSSLDKTLRVTQDICLSPPNPDRDNQINIETKKCFSEEEAKSDITQSWRFYQPGQ